MHLVTRMLLLAAAVALSACPPPGTSCGRGRCPQGSCIHVIATYPTASDEPMDWWCAVPCGGKNKCDQELCLMSPTRWNLEVCAGNQLEVKYRYVSGSKAGDLYTLSSFTVENAHVPGGEVDCLPDQVCSAGWYSSGELLPSIRGVRAEGGSVQVKQNGTPGERFPLSETAPPEGYVAPLGPLLPTGMEVIVNIGGEEHEQEDY